MKGKLFRKGIAFLLSLSMLGTMYIPANAEEDTSAQPDKAEVIAMIGDKEYTSLEDAVAAVPDNGTEATEIIIVKSPGQPFYVTPGLEIGSENASKNIVLDLRGSTLTFQPDTYSSDLSANGMKINYGSKVTIKNGITYMDAGKDGTKSNGSVIVNYGELYLTNGLINGTELDESGVTVRNYNQLTTEMTIVPSQGKPYNKALVTGNYKKGVNVQTTINGSVSSVYTEGSFNDAWGSDGKENISVRTYIKGGNINIVGVCYPKDNKDLNWTFEMEKSVSIGIMKYDGFCAKNGTKYYASMEKAKAEATEGDTIESLDGGSGETGGNSGTGGSEEGDDLEEKEMSVTSTVEDSICTATLEGTYSGIEDTDYLKSEDDQLTIDLTDADQDKLESYQLMVTKQTLLSFKRSETLTSVILKMNLGSVTIAKEALNEIASKAKSSDKDVVFEFSKNKTINYLYYNFMTTIDGQGFSINAYRPVKISVPCDEPQRGKRMDVEQEEGDYSIDSVYENGMLTWNEGIYGTYRIVEMDREPFEVWTQEGEKVGVYKWIDNAVSACNSTSKIVMVVNGILENTIPEGKALEISKGVTAIIPEGETLKISENATPIKVCAGAKLVNEGTLLICGESKDKGCLVVEKGATVDASTFSVPAGYIVGQEETVDGICYYAKSVKNAYYRMDYSDGTSRYYENMEDSLDYTNATKLTLLQEIKGRTFEIGAEEKVADTFVLDLNGYAIWGIEDIDKAMVTIEGHKVKIENSCGNVKSLINSISKNGSVLQVNAGADVSISYNIMLSSETGPGIYMNGGTVRVEGTIESRNGLCAITGNSESIGNKVILGRSAEVGIGAESAATAGTAVYQNYDGELIVQGGSIIGPSAIQINAGSLLIPEDSSVYMEADRNSKGEFNVTDGIVNDGSAIVVVEQPESSKVKSVEIKGGLVGSLKPLSAYTDSNNSNSIFDNQNKVIKMSGGVYANEPEKNYITSGLKAKKITGSRGWVWILEKEEGTLEVGGVRYSSLSEALEAAENSEDKTVTLLEDYVNVEGFFEDVQYNFSGKTIDLNGHIFNNLNNMSGGLLLNNTQNCEIKNGIILIYSLNLINCENIKMNHVELPGCAVQITDSENVCWNHVKVSDVNRLNPSNPSVGVSICANSKNTSLKFEDSEINVEDMPAIKLNGEYKNNLEIDGGSYVAGNSAVINLVKKNTYYEDKNKYDTVKITGGNFESDKRGLFSITSQYSSDDFIIDLLEYNNIEIGGGTYDAPVDYRLIGENFWNEGYRPIEIQDENGNLEYGVDNTVYINFMGGSLRKDAVYDDGTCNYHKTGLRFGYEVITNQAEILSWGWNYKSEKYPMTHWLDGQNKIDIKNGFITNFVVSGVVWENYSYDVNAELCVVYQKDNKKCTVKDIVIDDGNGYRVRSIYGVATSILNDKDATEDDKTFAEGIMNTVPR